MPFPMADKRLAADAAITPEEIELLLAEPIRLVATQMRRRAPRPRPRKDSAFLEARAVLPTSARCDRADLAPVSRQLPFVTCVANAASRAVETLAWRTSGTRPRFDAEELHHCLLGRPLEEGIVDPGRALRSMEQSGFPIAGRYNPPGPCPAPNSNVVRLGRWSRVRDESDAKSVISAGMPVVALITTNRDFMLVKDFRIWRDLPGSRELVHAILLVGYDDSGQFWELQNSFGTDWGDDGFGRLGYNESSLLADNRHAAFFVRA